ncbi:9028_t:CDS:2 [Paraglomus occultum]|uniref:9028_t:CDS:1 n=1 Tax=Paraglomus occultum TaxID=144539 RepID=A0A9N9DEN6_9GLOM|nr:9028_t:CDS:2 [Paraglomus occultum]
MDRYEEALKTYMSRPERKGKAIVQALRQFGSYLGNRQSSLLSIHRERRNEKSTERLVRRLLEERITLPCLAGSNEYAGVNWQLRGHITGSGHYLLANRGGVTFVLTDIDWHQEVLWILSMEANFLVVSTDYFRLPGARHNHSPPSSPPPPSCIIFNNDSIKHVQYVADAASALVVSVNHLRKRQYHIGEDYLSAAIEKELVHLYTVYQRNNSRIRNRNIIITAGEVKWLGALACHKAFESGGFQRAAQHFLNGIIANNKNMPIPKAMAIF